MVTTTTFSIHAYRNRKKENSLDTMSAKGQEIEDQMSSSGHHFIMYQF